jgi:predicted RNA-binding Zn-ribbon protein involved in translation (DUF1610 family)
LTQLPRPTHFAHADQLRFTTLIVHTANSLVSLSQRILSPFPFFSLAGRCHDKSQTTPIMICFSCPSCKQTLEVEERGAGLIVPCPTCGKQVTIPWKVQPVAAKPPALWTPSNPLQKSEPDVPPVIHAGVICLCIFAAVSLVGVIILHSQVRSMLDQFQQELSAMSPANISSLSANFSSLQLTMRNPITMEVQVSPSVFCLRVIFGAAALICAIVAMATNHVNKGLGLLVGAAVAIAIFYLVEGQIAHSAAQEIVETVNTQTAEMQHNFQQQMQNMFKPPNR